MILDSSAISNVIEEITLNEDLDKWNQNSELSKMLDGNNMNLRNHHDLIKPWESRDFKMILQSYISVRYKKDKVPIPNDFAEKVYLKTYNDNIKISSRFNMPQKVLYHPYITRDDYNFINSKVSIGQKVQLYGSLSAVFITSTLLYTTKWGRAMKNNPKQFYPFMGIPPIFMIFFAQVFNNYYVDYKLENFGLYQKYGLSPQTSQTQNSN